MKKKEILSALKYQWKKERKKMRESLSKKERRKKYSKAILKGKYILTKQSLIKWRRKKKW